MAQSPSFSCSPLKDTFRGHSPILVGCLTGIAEGDLRSGGDVLDNLLRQVLQFPEPERLKYITELWDLSEQVNGILNTQESSNSAIRSDRRATSGKIRLHPLDPPASLRDPVRSAREAFCREYKDFSEKKANE